MVVRYGLLHIVSACSSSSSRFYLVCLPFSIDKDKALLLLRSWGTIVLVSNSLFEKFRLQLISCRRQPVAKTIHQIRSKSTLVYSFFITLNDDYFRSRVKFVVCIWLVYETSCVILIFLYSLVELED